jgi:hypothetical protein
VTYPAAQEFQVPPEGSACVVCILDPSSASDPALATRSAFSICLSPVVPASTLPET